MVSEGYVYWPVTQTIHVVYMSVIWKLRLYKVDRVVLLRYDCSAHGFISLETSFNVLSWCTRWNHEFVWVKARKNSA